jgi:membrane associated rhomboid family serine protease
VIIPYGDDQVKGKFKPFFSYSFILLNIAIFVWQISDPNGNLYVDVYGSVPGQIMAGQDLATLLSSMFMHGDLMHLIGNMVFLWIFADNIEVVAGNFVFLLFYLSGGLVAEFIHIATDPASQIPTIGASGAISAVMGAYLVWFPKSKIKSLVIYFIPFPIRIWAVIFLGLWFFIQLSSGVNALAAPDLSGGVAWWAHIGGFAYGVIFALMMKPVMRQSLKAAKA